MANGLDIQGMLNQVQQRAQDIRPGVLDQLQQQLQARGATPRVLQMVQDRLGNITGGQGPLQQLTQQAGGGTVVRRVSPGQAGGGGGGGSQRSTSSGNGKQTRTPNANRGGGTTSTFRGPPKR